MKIIIETERLLIREIEEKDAEIFANMALDGSLTEVGFEDDCYNWIDNWVIEAKELTRKNEPTLGYLAYGIELKEQNILVGSVGCSYYEDLKETGITYFIGASYRGNGYAAEAITAYTTFFVEHYNISKLIATIKEENVSSWRAIENVGYKLKNTKMYKDINDDKEELYRFYQMSSN